MKKILIYGFKAFGRNKTNTSEQIIQTLPNLPEIKLYVFQVNFKIRDKLLSIFTQPIEKNQFDIILGLGQSRVGDKIKIETKAFNSYKETPKKPSIIILNAPKQLRTTLDLETNENAELSDDPGRYVCNFSMFTILNYIKENNLSTKYGFLHIPKDFDIAKATNYIQFQMDRLT